MDEKYVRQKFEELSDNELADVVKVFIDIEENIRRRENK